MANTNIYDMTDTWNAGGTTFTSIKMNVTDTASAAGSLLFDLQVSAASRFSVSKAGNVAAAGTLAVTGAATFSSTLAAANTTLASGSLSADANALTITQTWNNAGVTFSGALKISITDTASNSSSLIADFRVGGSSVFSVTKPGNLTATNLSSTFDMFPGRACVFGTGSFDVGLRRNAAGVLQVDDGGGSNFRDIYARNVRTQSVAVGSLVAAATAGAGARAFVNDSSVTTFGTTVAAGGANLVPVYSDGTNWKVG